MQMLYFLAVLLRTFLNIGLMIHVIKDCMQFNKRKLMYVSVQIETTLHSAPYKSL